MRSSALGEEDKTDFGLVKIHNDVLASIAYLAALEVEGVSRVCADWKSGVLQLLGKKTKCGAIDVKAIDGDGLSVIIPLIVKYGYNIIEVAGKVQEKVKTSIEEGADITLKDIVIKIKGVER